MSVPDFAGVPPAAQKELLRERQRAGGYDEGWKWVWQVNGDPETLRQKVAEITARIDNLAERMPPGAGPRLYQEGFLRAVTTALGYIEEAAGQPTEQEAS